MLYFRPEKFSQINYIYPNQNKQMNRIQEILDEKSVSIDELARLLHKSKDTITLYTSNQVQPSLPLNTDPRKLMDVTHP